MSLSGSLQVTEVSQLVNWARQGSRTGAIHFERGEVRKKLFFAAGRVVGSASSVPQEWLGHFLVGRGLITELELAKAIELQEESGMLLGSILVTIGGISEPQLNELLVEHCTEILCDLLTWSDGTFEFREGELPRGLVPADVDIGKALLEGVKRLDEWRRIRRVIPDLEMVPIALTALEISDEDPVAAQVLRRVDDDRSVEEILLDCHVTEYAGCLALTRAVEAGHVKLIAPRAPREPAGTAAAASGPAAAAAPAPAPPKEDVAVEDETPAKRRITAEDLLECSSEALQEGELEVARDYLEAARCLAGEDPSTLAKISRLDRALPRSARHAAAPEAPTPATAAHARAPERGSPSSTSPDGQTAEKPAYRSIPRSKPPGPARGATTAGATPASPPTPATAPAAPAATPLDRSSVPEMACTPEEIMNFDLTPEEGFLLTRVDGRMTLGELIKISPMPADQAERAIGRLVTAGHIALRPKV